MMDTGAIKSFLAAGSDVDEDTETLMGTYHLVGSGLKKMDKTHFTFDLCCKSTG